MGNFLPGMLDALLQILAAATQTASTNGPAFDLTNGAVLGALSSYSPNAGGVPMNLVIPITSFNIGGAADQSYGFKIQDSPDGTNWRDFSRTATLNAAGTGTDSADVGAGPGLIILGFFSRQKFVRLVSIIAGTSPSIVLGGAFLVPYGNSEGN